VVIYEGGDMKRQFNTGSANLHSLHQQLGIQTLDKVAEEKIINHLRSELENEAQQAGLNVKYIKLSKQGGGWYILSVVEVK
jgi:hypothetical protein